VTSIAWIRSAALAAVFTVLAVALALIPAGYWFPEVKTSLGLLALSVGFLLYAPSFSAARGGAIGLLVLGPTAALNSVMVLAASVALYTALHGYSGVSWALNAVVVGGFVVGWSLLRASANVASSVIQTTTLPSEHNIWISQVHGLVQVSTDASIKRQLATLAEQLRYVARDVPGVQLQENVRVASLLGDLSHAVRPDYNGTFTELMNALQAAIAQRELALKNLRTQM